MCSCAMVGNYEKHRIHTPAFLVIPNIQPWASGTFAVCGALAGPAWKYAAASDDVVVRGACRLLLEQVLQRDAVEVVADDAL